MSDLPDCPQCGSQYTYEDGNLYVCPECAHEWSGDASAETPGDEAVVKDANGNVLQDGDTVTVIKDLKVKGFIICGQGRHQGQKYPPGRWRP